MTHPNVDNFVRVLTFVCALGRGLMAGIFFAFSSKKALARLLPEQGIVAMQAINVAVLNRWFFAVFFGTAGCLLDAPMGRVRIRFAEENQFGILDHDVISIRGSVDGDGEITSQHYAFLVDENEFDEIFERIRERRLTYWADPGAAS